MVEKDPHLEIKARRAIEEVMARRLQAWKKAYLVSYPRSGNTLVREYFSILQGRPQRSIYEGDVVKPFCAALTRALDGIDLIKSHQMPPTEGPMIYLVRDGRNAAVSFLYMSFLFGGHQYYRLSELYDGLRHLDELEGTWGEHVAAALEQSKHRPVLFVRYEDLVTRPQAALAHMADFLGTQLSAEPLSECIRLQSSSDAYVRNPYNGYTYQPAKDSIYDILKRHRRKDYWRLIFDGRSKRYFHERGGTRFLLHFGYEKSADWWKE
jgi:Sulfotransferase domain